MPSLRRFMGIALVAARQLGAAGVHRLLRRWPRLAERLAGPRLSGPRRLRTFFERAGGAFIKLGQLLALQPDVLPLAYCNELYDLMDRVDPSPYADIEAVFKEELGMAPSEAFDRFDRTPLSTASIGQVHTAYRDGRKWAVKVRRAGADAQFSGDIRVLHIVLRLLTFLRAERFYWLRSPIQEFIDWTSEELDYRQEGRYMEEIRRNSRSDPRSRVPEVDWRLTTGRTLVAEYCEGITLLGLFRSLDAGDERLLQELKAQGFDPPTSARNIIDIFLRDAFMHGIFHADLHPANLLILPGNVIGYVDFGITGSLSGTTRRRLASLTIAWSRGDLERIAELFFLLARSSTEKQRRAYSAGLAELAQGWYETVEGLKRPTKRFTLVMLEMLALSHKTGIMPDRAVTRYLRSAMATDGLVKRFAPGLDVASELEAGCRRYLIRLQVREFFSPENVSSWYSDLGGFIEQTISGGPPERPRAVDRAGGSSPSASRALQLAVVGFVFASLGALTPGELGHAPGVLIAELGVSGLASMLLIATLLRLR